MTACNKRPPPDHPMHGTGVACQYREDHDPPCAWSFEPSPARRGLDTLLALLPFRTVEKLDSQPAQDILVTDMETREVSVLTTIPPGPWVAVTFVGGTEFAIWKVTGAVYRIGPDGTVEDDPILTV